jgi:hypothetical protein
MKNRMSFLEAHASEPTVASAILTAPIFLSGLSDAEVAMVRLKVEQHIAPEIIEARMRPQRPCRRSRKAGSERRM